jgi:hypothetical protein
MYKLLIAAVILSSTLSANVASSAPCTNSWTNPKTGKTECLNIQPTNSTSTHQTQAVNRADYIPGLVFLGKARNGDKYYLNQIGRGETFYDYNTREFLRQPTFVFRIHHYTGRRESTLYIAHCGRYELELDRRASPKEPRVVIPVPEDESSFGALAYNYVCQK